MVFVWFVLLGFLFVGFLLLFWFGFIYLYFFNFCRKYLEEDKSKNLYLHFLQFLHFHEALEQEDCKEKVEAFSMEMSSASPAQHSSGSPDKMLERQLVAHRTGVALLQCFVRGWCWCGLGITQCSSASPSSITRRVTAQPGAALLWGGSRCCLSFSSFSATGRCVCLFHHTHKTAEKR